MKVMLGLALFSTLAADPPHFDIQLGLGHTRPAALDLTASNGSLSVEPASQRGFTLRCTAAWAPAPSWDLETSLGWRFRSGGGLAYRSSATGSGRLDVNQILKGQMILGGSASRVFQARRGSVSLGAGMDLRAERLSAETGAGSSSGSLSRLWGRAVVRFAWPGAWRPFVAVEFAAPLSKPATAATGYIQDLDRLDSPSNPNAGTVAKAHAPDSEILLAFGLRVPR